MLTYHKKVIEFHSSGIWSFFDFEYPNRTNPIEDWYQGLSDDARMLFDGLLKDNRKTENPINWIGFRHYLKGKLREEKIWELGFYADGRQQRVLCKCGSMRKQAILLIGCYHKDQVYTPVDALETAYKRAKALSEGRANLHEREIKDDI